MPETVHDPPWLVRGLALELGQFRAHRRPGGTLHLGTPAPIHDMALCAFLAEPPGLARPCSERCRRVTALLTAAAEYLGVPVATFEPAEKPKKGRR